MAVRGSVFMVVAMGMVGRERNLNNRFAGQDCYSESGLVGESVNKRWENWRYWCLDEVNSRGEIGGGIT